jgi:ankyrin repeat protein
LTVHNLNKLEGSTEDYDIASRWLEDKSAGDQDYSHETASLSPPQSSVNGCSQTLEAHPALLSYAMFELFTHAQKAEAEGLDPSHVVVRLRDGAWDRWKALREDVNGRVEFLYFAASLGLSSWLKADRDWKEDEVISSMELAIDFKKSNALEKLLDAFPSVRYTTKTSGKILAILASAPDAGLLQAYMSRLSSQEHDSTYSTMEMKDILKSHDDDGRTALHLAVIHKNKAGISVLLKHGADVMARDFEGRTSLHLACTDKLLRAFWSTPTIDNARSDIIELLLSHHARVNALDYLDKTPLSVACLKLGLSCPGESKTREDLNVIDMLLKHGADTTIRNSRGSLPLHDACHVGRDPQDQLYIVSKLLDYGSPVNAAGEHGRTPLHDACSSSNVETVEELLRRGADPLSRDKWGYSPLHTAVLSSTEQVIETLLSFPGTSVDAMDNKGWTPLHSACSCSPWDNDERLPIIRRLLAHGAKAYTVHNRDGRSPADVARICRFDDALELMEEESCDSPARGLSERKGQRDC